MLRLNWHVNGQAPQPKAFMTELHHTLEAFKGGTCPVVIDYTSMHGTATIQLGDGWRIHPAEELMSRMKRLEGVSGVEVRYR